MKSNSYARTTRRNAKAGEHERGTREGGGGKNREEKTHGKETRRKRVRKGDGREVYSSDRQSSIHGALRTTIVGSVMTGLLLIPGKNKWSTAVSEPA